eukprot:767869-Hanusia_phi.AAC.6
MEGGMEVSACSRGGGSRSGRCGHGGPAGHAVAVTVAVLWREGSSDAELDSLLRAIRFTEVAPRQIA